MFIIMLIQFVGIVGTILLTFLACKKGLTMSISGGIDSNNKLGDGSNDRGKVKELNKPPLNNPNVSGENSGGNNQGAPASQGTEYGSPNLPDMRGADYGSYGGNASELTDMASGLSGVGAGGGAVAMVGLVNAIGVVGQSGDIQNYNIAGKHVIKGPVIQGGGMIFNDKLKGSKKLLQKASNGVTNTIQGRRTTITQSAPSRTAISAGRANIIQRGATTSYLSGPVNRFRNGTTENLKLKAPLTVQKLIAKKFTATKGTGRKLREITETRNIGSPMPLGYINRQVQLPPVVSVGVNNFNLRRISAVAKSNMIFTSPKDGKMIGIIKAYSDPKNADLSDVNKNKIGAIISVIEKRESKIIPNMMSSGRNNAVPNMIGSSSNNIVPNAMGNKGEDVSSNREQFDDILRKTLVVFPKMPAKAVITTAVSTAMMMNENNNRKIDRANRVADEQTNPENAKRNTLNNMLSNSSSLPSIQFNKAIDEMLKETHSISKERMEEIEKEAWEYVQKSQDIPPEQREEEYERIKNEKLEEEGGVTKDDLEEIVKQRILDSSEYAQVIIGEEGAKQLEDASNKAKEDRDKIVVQELIKQDVAEHAEYLKANPKARKKSYYEVYKERKDKELEQNITVAASHIYADKGRDFDKKKYQQLMGENGTSSGQEQSQEQEAPQPLNAPQIFIARGVQESNINGGV